MKGKKIQIRWRSVLLGAGVGVVALVTACAAVAGLMVNGTVEPDRMGYWAAGILVGSGLLGGLTAMQGGSGPAEAVLAGAGELAVLFGLNVGLHGGQVEGAAVTALALAGGCGAAVLLGQGRGRGRRGRRRKNR